MVKKQTAFRLSEDSLKMLRDLKEWNDTNYTAELEKAIRSHHQYELITRGRVNVD